MSSLPTRRQIIALRQQESLSWKVIHLLGSLKLALLLLAVIAIACAIATFTESHFDTKVAHAYIYKAPWFLAWLALLCINLFTVTLTRWPWEKKHFGFVITHYGIITLLIGAAIGSKFGFEGNVTLNKNGSPVQKITTSQSVLQIESPADQYLYLMPFDASLVHPTVKKPMKLGVPGTHFQIVIDGTSDQLQRVPFLVSTNKAPAGGAVIMKLSNPSSHQEQWVALGSGGEEQFDFFSLAEIKLLKNVLLSPVFTGSKPWLLIAITAEKKEINYQLGRGNSLKSKGRLAVGDWLPLGWGEWKMQLVAVGSHDTIGFRVEPMASGVQAVSTTEDHELPGFHAFLKDTTGEKGSACWVESGEVTPLTLGGDAVRVAYGLELKPIPFTIELVDFQIPRDEGTETPSDFKATVRFHNLKTNEIKEGLIKMNHPASFPGGFLANMTGINYKFSQAEWNPRDLNETTLQVLYDPGWLFKWIGSLAICIGIAMMFYLKPEKNSRNK